MLEPARYGVIKAQPQQVGPYRFRSKLELSWARQFTLWGATWDYVDEPWRDFVVAGCSVEIKPARRAFVQQAVRRVPQGERLLILYGQPVTNARNSYAIVVRDGVVFWAEVRFRRGRFEGLRVADLDESTWAKKLR